MKLTNIRIIVFFAPLFLIGGCTHSGRAVSGTIEVDEAHVGPRAPGRVQKIFAREGQSLKLGDPIVELDAAELPARAVRSTAIHESGRSPPGAVAA